jgi:HbrB-like
MTGLTASQIAAQAAMHVQNAQHNRKRSQTLPDRDAQAPPPPPPATATTTTGRRTPAFGQPSNPNVRFNDGFLGGHSLAAATAANAAFPRSPQYSPGLPPERVPLQVPPEREAKAAKEKTKMKLFSKPKSLGLSKDKDFDKKHPAMPSPNKMGFSGGVFKGANQSTTSLADPSISSGTSIYSIANSSTSTLVPLDKDKEKHRHHFLSRQKNKLKDEHYGLPLSSTSSTSKPTDPGAPQPLYSFAAPASPGHSSTFAKSVSGLDLRHGGRALREKKKEEKAAALAPIASSTTSLLEPFGRERENSFSQATDWPGPGSYSSTTLFGPSTGTSVASNVSDYSSYALSQAELANLGATFGVTGMAPDDAWPLLKARVLNIFEGEDPRPPIEDLNSLVSVHLRRSIQRRAPTIIIEDLNELLRTGFLSLDQTLRHVPEEKLVPHLVEMWMEVFTKILPFMQAVFHPIDLEFKGRGQMPAREAAEFWGAALPDSDVTVSNKNIPVLGEELDVRRISLLTFRDTVILPRHDALMAIFSRLSLESINANPDPLPSPLIPPIGGGSRPGTATSANAETPADSFNSTSTLLDTNSPFSTSSLSRSRATSNTSAGSFHSIANTAPHAQHQPMDSAKVTEMVGRTLQCVSVLASVQSGDEAQEMMEGLGTALKLNWLGRGRTGRQRRGFVGARVRRGNTNEMATPVGVNA